MIVEIPRWSNAKMEIATQDLLNSIKQQEEKGLPRFVQNIFPHKGYIWNCGILPQTWEDPKHIVKETGAMGDNGPIDVIEIGNKVAERGAVLQVKVVGTLAVIDEGQTDWKLVAIDVTDPLAERINDIRDVETVFPGLLAATVEWFQIRQDKMPSDKPANKFAFNGEFKNREYAENVIRQTYESWKNLVLEGQPPLKTECRLVGAAHHITAEVGECTVEKSAQLGDPSSLPGDVNYWYFFAWK